MHRRSTLDLNSRTVLITGAGSGIGAASARAMVRAGARVALVDLHQAALDEIVGELGPQAVAVVADVTSTSDLASAVEATLDRFSSLDVVFANAGIAASRPATIRSSSPEEFEKIVEVDLLGVCRTVQACLPHLVANHGHALVTSSVYAFANGMANAAYAMSKAGVESFGRSLRTELAGTGATAGVLYPGWVDTPIIAASHAENSASNELIRLGFPAPLRTPVPPAQVAAAVVHGIQRRKARIMVPRRWAPVSAARGVVNIATDAIFDQRSAMHSLLRDVERPE